MSKECLQEKWGGTPCFQQAGGTSCREKNCLTAQHMQELQRRGVVIDGWWKNMLLHGTCRISSLSSNNEEYLERTGRG